jgi:hypothetical protein
MSKETEKESIFQSFQKVISRVTQATNDIAQKIPFLSKDTQTNKETAKNKDTGKGKGSTDSFADSPADHAQPKNYTVLATSLTDVVSQLQALPTDSKGLRESLTNGVAILQDLKGTLLQGDPSKRDQSHVSAITNVIQNLEKLSKESTTSVNASNLTTVIAIATTTLNTVASTMTQVSASGIFNKIIEIVQQLMYPLLTLYLASLVSNEMIVYPAPMRVFFFLFVLVLCSVFSPATVILVFYYLVKAGYSYYRNELEDRDGDTTPIRIYPRIFAILPIATTPATSFVGRFFKYPFYYPKTEEDRKELERTDGDGNKKGSIMDEYMEALKESFPYGETVKGSEPFAERYATIEKNMKRMHQAPAVPSVPIASTDTPTLGSKGPSLPPVIQKATGNAASSAVSKTASNAVSKTVSNAASNTVSNTVSNALPAVIPLTSNAASKAASKAASNAASKALPGVITPTSTQANILKAMDSGSKAPQAVPNVVSNAVPNAVPNAVANPVPKTIPMAPKMPALVRRPVSPTQSNATQSNATQSNATQGGAIKTRSPTSGGWLWNGI